MRFRLFRMLSYDSFIPSSLSRLLNSALWIDPNRASNPDISVIFKLRKIRPGATLDVIPERPVRHGRAPIDYQLSVLLFELRADEYQQRLCQQALYDLVDGPGRPTDVRHNVPARRRFSLFACPLTTVRLCSEELLRHQIETMTHTIDIRCPLPGIPVEIQAFNQASVSLGHVLRNFIKVIGKYYHDRIEYRGVQTRTDVKGPPPELLDNGITGTLEYLPAAFQHLIRSISVGCGSSS